MSPIDLAGRAFTQASNHSNDAAEVTQCTMIQHSFVFNSIIFILFYFIWMKIILVFVLQKRRLIILVFVFFVTKIALIDTLTANAGIALTQHSIFQFF